MAASVQLAKAEIQIQIRPPNWVIWGVLHGVKFVIVKGIESIVFFQKTADQIYPQFSFASVINHQLSILISSSDSSQVKPAQISFYFGYVIVLTLLINARVLVWPPSVSLRNRVTTWMALTHSLAFNLCPLKSLCCEIGMTHADWLGPLTVCNTWLK